MRRYSLSMFVAFTCFSVASFTLASPAAVQICKPAKGVKWISMSDIRRKVDEAGYKGFRIGFESGCYEAEGVKGGKELEVFLDPVSGKIVKVREDLD